MSIVYKSNLNFERLRKYLELLLSTGLVEASIAPGEVKRYVITRKGQEFIAGYDRLMDLLELPGTILSIFTALIIPLAFQLLQPN